MWNHDLGDICGQNQICTPLKNPLHHEDLAPAISNAAALGGSWNRIGSGEDSDTLENQREVVKKDE